MSYQADATAVAPVVSPEVALFQYLDEQKCKWARLNYKRGKFILKFTTQSKDYHYAEGKDLQELLVHLEERIMRLSA